MQLLDRVEKTLKITHPDDWYTVRLTDLREIAGMPKTLKRKDLTDLLKKKYPQHEWDAVRFLRGRHARQKLLERTVRALFPVGLIRSRASFVCLFSDRHR